MGTRSHIYIETDTGFIGAYCQFDGYPDHMCDQLVKRSHREMYGIILKATCSAGMRALSDGGPDYYEPRGEIEVLSNPYDIDESLYVDYVYIKSPNGDVSWRHAAAIEWHQALL